MSSLIQEELQERTRRIPFYEERVLMGLPLFEPKIFPDGPNVELLRERANDQLLSKDEEDENY
jgi:hypothetical protein